jgi:hypothetical protein
MRSPVVVIALTPDLEEAPVACLALCRSWHGQLGGQQHQGDDRGMGAEAPQSTVRHCWLYCWLYVISVAVLQ